MIIYLEHMKNEMLVSQGILRGENLIKYSKRVWFGFFV